MVKLYQHTTTIRIRVEADSAGEARDKCRKIRQEILRGLPVGASLVTAADISVELI